ncbi:MAG TPA: hypothetical protein VNB22_25335 [Pyrinomonadaceae bacterium]|nr:hypothetical protein [Pyrinomonadaceae bacterium]
MLKRGLIFSLAFGLSLILLQFLKPKVQTESVEIISSPTLSSNSQIINPNQQDAVNYISSVNNFFHKFQNALGADDKETIVSLIKFPVEISFIDKRNKAHLKSFKNEAELLQDYDKIFDYSFKKTIAQIEARNLLLIVGVPHSEFWTAGHEIRMKPFNKNNDEDFEIKVISINKHSSYK